MKTKTFSDVFSFQQRVSGEYYTCENLKIAKKCFITNEVMENIIFTRNNSSSLFKVRIIYLDKSGYSDTTATILQLEIGY